MTTLDSRIERDRQVVKQYFEKGCNPYFGVLDTCRKDNGGILEIPSMISSDPMSLVSFVPAAGAASRFVNVFSGLVNAARCRDKDMFLQAADHLRSLGATTWPLPQLLSEVLKGRLSESDLTLDLLDKISLVGVTPKAEFPAVRDGTTFLELKCIENDAMPEVCASVFVSPIGKCEEFQNISQKLRVKKPVWCLEQGLELSTVRFNDKLEVVLEKNMQPSWVPAGHGALVAALPHIRNRFPHAQYILIRNIDNVTGIRPEVLNESQRFAKAVQTVFHSIKTIRSHLETDSFEQANEVAHDLLQLLSPDALKSLNHPREVLRLLQEAIFHTPKSVFESDIKASFRRPVNIFGMVSNSGKDIGGVPCWVDLNGVKTKLCLESSHASIDDRSAILADSRKATHFNPVWVAAEILPDLDKKSYYPQPHPFWLVAKKQYFGQDVYYVETLLYEILSCSTHVNAIFFEIPRKLFNPHKLVEDARGRVLADWS